MNREEILNKVRNCTPGLGWDTKYPDLYGKYGMTISGIYEGWHWFEEDNITDYARKCGHLPLTDATNSELLQMWAIADNYWLNQYMNWYHKEQDKAFKLHAFISKCERKYFGYDEDGYTDKTIDRVFNSIFNALDNPQEAVKVIRCKDCKYYSPYKKPVEDFDGRCSIHYRETDEMEYCSNGVMLIERQGGDASEAI